MSLFLQQLINGLSLGAIYALIALGYTMVYGTLQLINFAHSEVYMMGAFAALYMARWTGVAEHPTVPGVVGVLLCTMVFCAILGMSVERVAYRPLFQPNRKNRLIASTGLFTLTAAILSIGAVVNANASGADALMIVTRYAGAGFLAGGVAGLVVEPLAERVLGGKARLNSLITAIGMSLLLQNVALQSFGALDSFPELIPAVKWMPVEGVIVRSADVLTLSTTLVLMLILRHVVENTQLGRAMRAVSHSRDTAALMGINVDRVIAATFAIGSMLAGAGAFLITVDRLQVSPTMGATDGLKAFVAAVLGGIGSIPGAVAGGLLLGLCETFVAGYLASTWRDAIAFILLIVVLLYKPSGLFGKATVEKV